MERTTVLITGCSSGIGLALAARLAADAEQRFKVFATMRDPSRGERLRRRVGARGPEALEVLPLDVADPRAPAAAARRLRGQRLDVLVCNAGVGLMGPLETCSEAAMRRLFEVNVFGAVRTIQAFLPAMKRRGAGRILVSSSIGGLQGLPFNALYCASKFALEGLCESLALVLQPLGIHVTLVECGPVHTRFLANARRPAPAGRALRRLDAATRRLYGRYVRHCRRLFREAAQDVEDVVEVFVQVLSSPRPPLRRVTTERFAPLTRLRRDSPDGDAFLRAARAFVFGDEQP
ncbi:17-beta-hydroxysteroid dehydrogenase type 1 [Eudromia elegans]